MNNLIQGTLTLILFILLNIASLNAQTLNANGDLHQVDYSGTFQDFTIPSGGALNGSDFITFFLKGADGGKSNPDLNSDKKAGGGATVEVDFEIGTNNDQLHPGGVVRVIVGENGSNGRGDSGSFGGGGGGGTGLLYKAPGATISCNTPSTNLADASTCWVLLAVAGGGGGASKLDPGRNGNTSPSGDAGGGNAGGDGGMAGGAGSAGNAGGGGGGYSGGGSGKKGSFTGGQGGSGIGSQRKGGYGYGGGGSGSTFTGSNSDGGGGGGGGYSGGGGGGKDKAGGGGGSFSNSKTIESIKENGSQDGTPNNGRFYYEFSVFDPTKPKAICKDISVTLSNGSYTLNASQIDDNSVADPGESIAPFILRKIAGTNIPVSSINFDCSDIGEKSVTLQVISTSGKKDKCVAYVQVKDDVAPSVTCGTPFQLAATVTRGQNYILDPDIITQGSNDACGQIVDKYLSQSEFTCEDAGSNTVTLFVEDNSGNVGSCNFTFNLGQMNEALSINCPADASFSVELPDCSATLDDSIIPDLNGPCYSTLLYEINDGVNTIESGAETPVGSMLSPGNYTLTYTHSYNGGSDNCSFHITVNDPLDAFDLFCPGPVDVDLDNDQICTFTIPAGSLDPTTGLCGTVNNNLSYQITNSVSGNITNGMGLLPDIDFEAGINTVTYTLGVNSCNFEVIVNDVIPPSTNCPPVIVALDANCEATVTTNQLGTGITDACGGLTFEAFYSDCSTIPCTDVGPVSSITYTTVGDYDVIVEATDANGNTSSCSVVVIVEPQPTPSAQCLNISRTLNVNNEAAIAPEDVFDTATNDCNNAVPILLSQEVFDCSNIGGNTITLTVQDANGNQANCQSVVTIEDNTAPSANCKTAYTIYLDANGEAVLTPSMIDEGASDNCGNISLTFDDDSSEKTFDCTDVDSNVSLKVTDNSGNSSTCSTLVSIVDDIPPTASCKNETIAVDENGAVFVPSGSLVENFGDNCNASLNEIGFQFNCEDIGNNTVTVSFQDESGNQGNCQSIVTIEDNIAPSAECKLSKILDLDANGEALLTPDMIDNNSSDNCGSITLTFGNGTTSKTYNCNNISTTSVTLKVTDHSGNQSICSTLVTARDVSPPTGVCKDATVQLGDDGTVFISNQIFIESLDDNCGSPQTLTTGFEFDCEDIGVSTITINFRDDNFNFGECQSTVTVEDVTPPAAACTFATIQLDGSGMATLDPYMINNDSHDACGDASFSLSQSSFSCADLGEQTVTLYVSDAAGNTSSCNATVTVDDQIKPQAKCKILTTINLDANGQAILTPAMVDNNSSDNCGPVTLEFGEGATEKMFDCNTITSDVTIFVNDASGNYNSCVSFVIVNDPIAPIALCQDITTQLDENGTVIVTGTQLDGGTTDNCENVITTDIFTFNCDQLGAHPVSVSFSDFRGNSSSCQATITIEDDTPPIAYCFYNTVNIGENGFYLLQESDVFDAANSSDNCGIDEVVFNSMTFTCADEGQVFTIPVVVTDASGNASDCEANITVEVDNNLPGGWTGNDIGVQTFGNKYAFEPCEQNGVFYITGSGNNATSSTTDNVAFASQSLCGNGAILAKIESVGPYGYGGLMIRETTDAGAKQTAIFSNMSSMLRHEVRYNTNGVKQVNSFFKPSPVWLKLERQGDWVFAYYSSTGGNFQYVHAVYVSMQDCVEIGLASFTYLPNAQTEAVFSNISISGSNGSYSLPNSPITTSPYEHFPTSPYNDIDIFPNPTNNQFTLRLPELVETNKFFELYNATGQLMETRVLAVGHKEMIWNTQDLSQGVYWLKAIGENQIDKIVIAR